MAAASAASSLCEAAVHAAERQYRLPIGLLGAISRAESGRPDPATHRLAPWPWTVQAEDRGMYFDTKDQAVRWVRDAMARGITSIDTGCLQVNLAYHPYAFATLDAAFDPRRNADYAARFLLQLHTATGDWRQATGFYHSQTATLALSYEARVQRILGGSPARLAPAGPPRLLAMLGNAWHATTDTPGDQSAAPLGRGWDALLTKKLAP
jgi:hypothetical protein